MTEESKKWKENMARLSGSKLVEIPEGKRLTGKGALELETEISSNIEMNNYMRFKSTINASKV